MYNYGNSDNNNYRGYEMIEVPAPKKKKGLFKKIMSVVLCGLLFGAVSGGAFYGINAVLADDETSASSSQSSLTATSLSASSGSSSGSLDVTGIAEQGLKSVVSVTNISVQEVQNYFGMFGRNGRGSTQTTETMSVGSGIIIYESDTYLYMVTNYHVVEDATTISVTFVDDETYESILCGYDEDSDIAVIKVTLSDLTSDTLSQIAVVEIGSSDDLTVGEQVVAIGNALGYGQSVTTGIVSAVDRTISDDETSGTYIQTDAAINPGNSGGALLNMDGQLVGINTAKISSTGVEGMGYAIPISQVLEIITELMN
ncbi:MAG: trypsin-like peptidase domain-containing protein [Clostridiales bacterium]|nr:trypsin-like peptidase domain-containing protein [Clostridiales bacterium]